MCNSLNSTAVGNGIFDADSGQLIASDAVLKEWLGPRPFNEFLPALDIQATDTGYKLTRIFPVSAEPNFAAVKFTPLHGNDQNWRLVRIEVAPATSESNQYRDVVTGLPDRRALESHREQWQRESPDGQIPHALLFMDLDNFKPINDQLGHAIGDRVLTVLANRWRKSLRSRDLIVRYGGDEFVLLLADVRSLEDAQPILERLRRVTSDPIVIKCHTLEMHASIGVVLAEDITTPLIELVASADQSMYAAKRKSL